MVGISLGGKHPDFAQLQAEMMTAGVGIVGGIGSDGTTVWTYNTQGQPVDFSPAEIAAIQATIAAHAPVTAGRDAVVALAQSAVGTTVANLTPAQVRAILVCIAYKNGAIDRATSAVLPLNQWLT